MADRTTFFGEVLDALIGARIPFVVGGGYALCRHIGIEREVKDLDLMIAPFSWPAVARTLGARGIETVLTFPHWLGKAVGADVQVDVIFSGGNGLTTVDRDWFRFAVANEVLGRQVRLAPVEEMIWSKAFVMERERFDGSDVLHLLRAFADRMDWERLVRRFAGHEAVLRAHVVLFGYVYPGEAHRVPDWVERRLADAALIEEVPAALCRGTLLSRAQYLVDVEDWGYIDARLPPFGQFSRTNWLTWTNAIDADVSRVQAKVRDEVPHSAAADYVLGHEGTPSSAGTAGHSPRRWAWP